MQVRMVVVPHDREMSCAHLDQFGDRTILRVHLKRTSWRSLHGQSQNCVNHATMARDQY